MKYGFVAMYDQETAQFAAKAGFDGMEIFVGPIIDVAMGLDILNMSDDEIKRVVDYVGGLGIGFTTLSCNPIHLHGDPAKRAEAGKHFRKALESAKLMGTDIVVTNAFTDRTKSPVENLVDFKEVFGEYTKIAESEGVKIAIENCPHWHGTPPVHGNLAYSPEMWEAMFDAVPSKALGLEFDPSHLVWQGIDYLRAMREFGDRIYAYHAKDTEMLPEGQYRFGVFGQQLNTVHDWPGGWWRYRIPGYGQVDWQAIQYLLYEMEYNGPMVIEHEDHVFGGDRSENGLGLGPRTELGLKLGLAHLKSVKLI